MRLHKTYGWKLWVAMIGLMMVLGGVASVQAQDVPPDIDPPPGDEQVPRRRVVLLASFGMVGIAPTQTARLNLTSLCPTLHPRLEESLPERPPMAHLMFYDAEGNLLASSSEPLLPGRSSFLDLDGALLPVAHTSIRGVVAIPTVLDARARSRVHPCDIPVSNEDEIMVLLRPTPGSAATDSFFDVFVDVNMEIFHAASGETATVLEDPLTAVGIHPRDPATDGEPAQ